MYHVNLAGVCILFVTAFCATSSALKFRAGHRPHYMPARNCDAENKNAVNEIKSEIQKLQQLVVGLRQKLDPDFELPPTPPPPRSKCLPGFQYVEQALSCYKIVNENLNWSAAGQRCQELHPDAHLAAITSYGEHVGLIAYLDSEITKNSHGSGMHDVMSMLWTSGQRLNETSCTDEFVWKMANSTQLPLSFTNWEWDEPNCHSNQPEGCLLLKPFRHRFTWNDAPCDVAIFPLCECDPL